MFVRELDKLQCATVFSANRLARLVCTREDRPYAVPIFYAAAGDDAYAFTRAGRKLETMRANPNVALLVEENQQGGFWKSVLAEGRFEELPNRIGFKRERDHAWSLVSRHPNWWEPGALKPELPASLDDARHVFFRIHIERMSGREAVDE